MNPLARGQFSPVQVRARLTSKVACEANGFSSTLLILPAFSPPSLVTVKDTRSSGTPEVFVSFSTMPFLGPRLRKLTSTGTSGLGGASSRTFLRSPAPSITTRYSTTSVPHPHPASFAPKPNAPSNPPVNRSHAPAGALGGTAGAAGAAGTGGGVVNTPGTLAAGPHAAPPSGHT